jgi:hypothetical protein
MQPEDRRDGSGRHPHPVDAEGEHQRRQRQRGPETPARLLPESSDDRLALAAGQPRQQVHRGPAHAGLDNSLQPA